MAYNEATDRELYTKLIDFYPRVTPSMEFVSNLFTEFEKEKGLEDKGFSPPWAVQLANWLPSKTGLIRDPLDVNWDKFIVVDQGLYAFALLRYS